MTSQKGFPNINNRVEETKLYLCNYFKKVLYTFGSFVCFVFISTRVNHTKLVRTVLCSNSLFYHLQCHSTAIS